MQHQEVGKLKRVQFIFLTAYPEGSTGYKAIRLPLFAPLDACGTVYEKMESLMVVQFQDLMEELHLLRITSCFPLTDTDKHEMFFSPQWKKDPPKLKTLNYFY